MLITYSRYRSARQLLRSLQLFQSSHTDNAALSWSKRDNSRKCNFCGKSFTRSYSLYTTNDGSPNIRSSPPWRVLFFGSDNFSLFTLKKLNENRSSKSPSSKRKHEDENDDINPRKRHTSEAFNSRGQLPDETLLQTLITKTSTQSVSETSVLKNDVGTFSFKQNLSDEQKYHLLRKHFIPSRLYEFPVTKYQGRNRTFQLAWLREQTSVIERLAVVSKPGQSVVRRYSEEAGLKVNTWPIILSPDEFDVGVLVSFGHYIPGKIINSFPYGIINVHPSILPRWRGASPLIHTILNGDMESGISITELRTKHFDIGPLLMQKKVTVPSNCDTQQLGDHLGPIGADMMVECLHYLPTLEKKEVPQDNQGVTYAHKISPEMGFIDWENQTRESISRQYRALNHMYPLKSYYGDIGIKLLNMVEVTDAIDESILHFHGESHINLPPGSACYGRRSQVCWVKCKDGWVGFRDVQIKKKMSALSFNNGYLTNPLYKDYLFTSHKNHLLEHIKEEAVISS